MLVLIPVALRPAPARASHTYVDRRVSAIPAAALLAKDPSQLVDPRRQQVARELAWFKRGDLLFGVFLQVLALVFLWRSGNAARLRDALGRSVKNPIAQRFLFGAGVATVAALAALPAAIAAYRLALAYELTVQPVVSWLRDALLAWMLAGLVVGMLTAFVYALVDRTRLWYLYAAAGLFAFVLGAGFVQPVLVAPLFDSARELAPADPVGVEIRMLERRAHVPDAPVYVDDRSRRTTVANAQVSGFGPTERIVLADTLLSEATPQEIGFVTAHELAHYVHGDVFRLSVVWTLTLVLCVAIGVAVADRVGFRRDDDPLARLPLVGALFGIAALVVLPLYNAYARGVESSADRYALALTGDRAAAVRTFVRFSDESLSPLCPSRLERDYFLDHPPLGSRIATALGRPDPCP